MSADLGPGDLVEAVRDVGLMGVTIVTQGTRYTVGEVLPMATVSLREFGTCVQCNEVQRRVVTIASLPRYYFCHCAFRKISGGEVLEKFREALLKPTILTPEPIDVPKKVPEKTE